MLDLYLECAPTVAPETIAAVVRVESGGNPYAIGIVGGHLERQPQNKEEAIATATYLQNNGWSFSLGLTQVHISNFDLLGLTIESAFEPCTNVAAGAKVLQDCYSRALVQVSPDPQIALQAAFSCYYSGNFSRGFTVENSGTSYVSAIYAQADTTTQPIRVVPAVQGQPRTNNNVSNGQNRQVQQMQINDVRSYPNEPMLRPVEKQAQPDIENKDVQPENENQGTVRIIF